MTEPNKMLRGNKFELGGKIDAAAAVPVESHHAQPKAIPDLANGKDEELWSIKTVSQKTGLSRASIYRYIAKVSSRHAAALGPDGLPGSRQRSYAGCIAAPVPRRPNTQV